MAKAKKDPATLKTAQIGVRVSPSEYEEIEKAARIESVNLGASVTSSAKGRALLLSWARGVRGVK